MKEQFLVSFFASVTARTAGFNVVDYGALTIPTLLLTILLMLIGGCPGSTAGGIKATTLGVMLALFRSRLRARRGSEYIPSDNSSLDSCPGNRPDGLFSFGGHYRRLRPRLH